MGGKRVIEIGDKTKNNTMGPNFEFLEDFSPLAKNQDYDCEEILV